MSFDLCIATAYRSGWHTGSVDALFVELSSCFSQLENTHSTYRTAMVIYLYISWKAIVFRHNRISYLEKSTNQNTYSRFKAKVFILNRASTLLCVQKSTYNWPHFLSISPLLSQTVWLFRISLGQNSYIGSFPKHLLNMPTTHYVRQDSFQYPSHRYFWRSAM